MVEEIDPSPNWDECSGTNMTTMGGKQWVTTALEERRTLDIDISLQNVTNQSEPIGEFAERVVQSTT